MKDKYIDEERDDSILPAAEDQELMSVREKRLQSLVPNIT